jgi:hypothetical protein
MWRSLIYITTFNNLFIKQPKNKIMQTLPKIEETLIAVIKTLPIEKQQALLEFAEFLQAKTISKAPSKNIKGLWANADINLTEEDLAPTRKEMWANFPKDIEI